VEVAIMSEKKKEIIKSFDILKPFLESSTRKNSVL
jgi:hypothetical protein